MFPSPGISSVRRKSQIGKVRHLCAVLCNAEWCGIASEKGFSYTTFPSPRPSSIRKSQMGEVRYLLTCLYEGLCVRNGIIFQADYLTYIASLSPIGLHHQQEVKPSGGRVESVLHACGENFLAGGLFIWIPKPQASEASEAPEVPEEEEKKKNQKGLTLSGSEDGVRVEPIQEVMRRKRLVALDARLGKLCKPVSGVSGAAMKGT